MSGNRTLLDPADSPTGVGKTLTESADLPTQDGLDAVPGAGLAQRHDDASAAHEAQRQKIKDAGAGLPGSGNVDRSSTSY